MEPGQRQRETRGTASTSAKPRSATGQIDKSSSEPPPPVSQPGSCHRCCRPRGTDRRPRYPRCRYRHSPGSPSPRRRRPATTHSGRQRPARCPRGLPLRLQNPCRSAPHAVRAGEQVHQRVARDQAARRHRPRWSAPNRGTRSRSAGTCPADSRARLLWRWRRLLVTGLRPWFQAGPGPPCCGGGAEREPPNRPLKKPPPEPLFCCCCACWRLRLLQLPFHALDAVLRLGQRVLLHEGELGDAIARSGIAAEQVGDQPVSLGIDRGQWRRCGGGHRTAERRLTGGCAPLTRAMNWLMMSRSSFVIGATVGVSVACHVGAAPALLQCRVRPRRRSSITGQRSMATVMPAARARMAAASSTTPSCIQITRAPSRIASSTSGADIGRGAEHIDHVRAASRPPGWRPPCGRGCSRPAIVGFTGMAS